MSQTGPYKNATTKTVTLTPGQTYLVQAFSNAALSQCVQIAPPSGATAQFDGTKEGNVPMGLTTSGFLTPSTTGGWASFTTPSTGSMNYTVTISNSGNFQGQAQVNSFQFSLPDNENGSLSAVSYEDNGGGSDYNDSVVLFQSWGNPPSR
jgi:hypothetical protein